MAEEETQDQQEPTQEAAAAQASKKPLVVGVACVLAGALAGATILPAVVSALGHPQEQTEQSPKPQPPPERKGVLLDKPITVMVNLADENARRVLKADIILEARDRSTLSRVAARLFEIKNSLIALLSEKRLSDIEGAEAKGALRREIKLFVNERLAIPDAVLNVYFDQFIVQ